MQSVAALKRGYASLVKQFGEFKDVQKKHYGMMKSMKKDIDGTFTAHGLRVNSIEQREVDIEDYYKEEDASHPTQAAAEPAAVAKKASPDIGI